MTNNILKGFSKTVANLLSLTLVIGVLTAHHSHAATTNVAFGGGFTQLTFRPSIITIHVGDTVIWTNAGGTHSVTGNSAAEPLCGGTLGIPGCTNTFNTPGQYAYHCSLHVSSGMTGLVNVVSSAIPPSAGISNPTNGSIFASPASIKISATVTNGSSPVTNVDFLLDGNTIGSQASSPFELTASNLAAGNYNLTVRASDNAGLSSISAPVNISVVDPVTISNFLVHVDGNQFLFNHTANPGLSYVVENSSNLVEWTPVATNTATTNQVQVTNSFQVGGLRFYRVGRLPNP
jgi:plastocyanin